MNKKKEKKRKENNIWIIYILIEKASRGVK